MSALSQADVRTLLSYDPETGALTWKVTRGKARPGGLAGGIWRDGYRLISVGNKRYPAHRLAWLIVYGEWPELELDHINGNRDDNRLVNLRAVSRMENQKNLKLSKMNTSGVVGVVYHRKTGKWQAQIGLPDKSLYLGLFSRFEDAVSARKSAEIEYGFHPNHGRTAQDDQLDCR